MALVEVHKDRCQGHGQCVMAAPAVFELDDDGLSEPVYPEIEGPDLEAARAARSLCPAAAIEITG